MKLLTASLLALTVISGAAIANEKACPEAEVSACGLLTAEGANGSERTQGSILAEQQREAQFKSMKSEPSRQA
jgi:hypothetical protein